MGGGGGKRQRHQIRIIAEFSAVTSNIVDVIWDSQPTCFSLTRLRTATQRAPRAEWVGSD